MKHIFSHCLPGCIDREADQNLNVCSRACSFRRAIALLACVATVCAQAQRDPDHLRIANLSPRNVLVDSVEYRGKRAVRLLEDPEGKTAEPYAVVKGIAFHNGELEVDLAGGPAPGAGPLARGFVGIGFRMQDGRFEQIYLRPTNGRAEDQVRRNHSTQYSSHPDFGFAEMRQQSPGKYESYVDLETGAWTRYRITVEGTKARLFINDSAQPCLIVNDLKLGDSSGGVALTIGPGTEAYFSGLRIRHSE